MNLSGIWNGLPDLLRPQQTGSPAPANSTAANSSTSQALVPNGGKTDHADLSSSGLAAQSAASDVASATSDVRMDKVDSVRAAIGAGTYNVSAQNVADKMIQGLLG